MIDLSDGLGRDLPRLCRASGVGARLEAASIPVHDDARALALDDGRTPLGHALGDGEDFELLVAHAALDREQRRALEAAGVALVPIGAVTRAPAVVVATAAGEVPLAGGWDHLAGH